MLMIVVSRELVAALIGTLADYSETREQASAGYISEMAVQEISLYYQSFNIASCLRSRPPMIVSS
jgi:hypothetical protein